ncbi:hypothetical protein [Vallicoccus soli]|uniref:PH domain-containing protein n=1 Tax=Vallicoccus soli TaxID=2339232 RepID=A0A3A3Z0N9_9ACTN|nr:hypothetical protein [Vallicoccus soli]RJK96753.1 hypothetical protein D5H78_05635 [Vallicoccus soli]
MILLAAEQQEVTRLPERLAWTGLTLLVVVGIVLLAWRGWRRRAAAQGDVPPLPEAPDDLGDGLVSAEGTYVVTTTEGDWLDRIVVHGLGVRSAAILTVAERGVLFEREGAPDVWVPAAAMRGVRLERGMAGKFVEEGGLVVITWQHGERSLDSGFRNRRAEDRDAIVAAVQRIAGERR